MTNRKHNEAIELQGPEDPTLTLPPERQTGMLLALGVAIIFLVGVLGVLLIQPALVADTVQAFVGR